MELPLQIVHCSTLPIASNCLSEHNNVFNLLNKLLFVFHLAPILNNLARLSLVNFQAKLDLRE